MKNTMLEYSYVVYWVCFPSFIFFFFQRIMLATTININAQGDLREFLPFALIEVIGVNPCAMSGKEDP